MRRQVCTAAPDGAELPCERSTDRIQVPVLDLGRVHFSRSSGRGEPLLEGLRSNRDLVFFHPFFNGRSDRPTTRFVISRVFHDDWQQRFPALGLELDEILEIEFTPERRGNVS